MNRELYFSSSFVHAFCQLNKAQTVNHLLYIVYCLIL